MIIQLLYRYVFLRTYVKQCRVRKKHLERMAVAAIKIQALARGASARTRVRRIYKRLVRARDKRIHEKRLRSAAMIQSIVRMRNARKIVNMKREQFLERERKRKQLEELDINSTAFILLILMTCWPSEFSRE